MRARHLGAVLNWRLGCLADRQRAHPRTSMGPASDFARARSALRATVAHPDASIALGDWNFTSDASDGLHTADTGLYLAAAAADTFAKVSADFRELSQPMFALSLCGGDAARRMFSRLHRACTNIPRTDIIRMCVAMGVKHGSHMRPSERPPPIHGLPPRSPTPGCADSAFRRPSPSPASLATCCNAARSGGRMLSMFAAGLLASLKWPTALRELRVRHARQVRVDVRQLVCVRAAALHLGRVAACAGAAGAPGRLVCRPCCGGARFGGRGSGAGFH